MTVGQLLATISSEELVEWQAYFVVERELVAERRQAEELERDAIAGAADVRQKLRRR